MTFCGCGMAVFIYFCILLGVVVPVVHSSSQIHYLIYSVCLFIIVSKTTVSILANNEANIDTIQGSTVAFATDSPLEVQLSPLGGRNISEKSNMIKGIVITRLLNRKKVYIKKRGLSLQHSYWNSYNRYGAFVVKVPISSYFHTSTRALNKGKGKAINSDNSITNGTQLNPPLLRDGLRPMFGVRGLYGDHPQFYTREIIEGEIRNTPITFEQFIERSVRWGDYITNLDSPNLNNTYLIEDLSYNFNNRDNPDIHYEGHPDPLVYELLNPNIPNIYAGQETAELFAYDHHIFPVSFYPRTWRYDTIEGRLRMNEVHGKLRGKILRQMNDSLYTPDKKSTDREKREVILELISHLNHADRVYHRYTCGDLEPHFHPFPPNDLSFFKTRDGDKIPEWARDIDKEWLLRNEENVVTTSWISFIIKKLKEKVRNFIRMSIRYISYIAKILGGKRGWILKMLIRLFIIKFTLPLALPLMNYFIPLEYLLSYFYQWITIWENVKSGKLNIYGDIALPDSKELEKVNSSSIPSPLEIKKEPAVIEYISAKDSVEIEPALEQISEIPEEKGYQLPGMDNPEDPFPLSYENLYDDKTPSEAEAETEKGAPKPSEKEGDSVKDSSNKKKDDYGDGNGSSSKKQKYSFTIKKG